MILSTVGANLIQSFESLRLAAYLDQRGIPTIGWGHTGKDVYIGLVWSPVQCATAFNADVAGAEAAVTHGCRVVLTQNQFDALVSFTFNEGGGAFASSTLLKLINQGQADQAAAQFPLWDKTHINGVLVEDAGLKRRRAAEQALFLTA